MKSSEYDKKVSDRIEEEIIQEEQLSKMSTYVILRHLVGRLDDFKNKEDLLLSGKHNSFYDFNGDIWRVKFTKD